jgi:hypothetical protein
MLRLGLFRRIYVNGNTVQFSINVLLSLFLFKLLLKHFLIIVIFFFVNFFSRDRIHKTFFFVTYK